MTALCEPLTAVELLDLTLGQFHSLRMVADAARDLDRCKLCGRYNHPVTHRPCPMVCGATLRNGKTCRARGWLPDRKCGRHSDKYQEWRQRFFQPPTVGEEEAWEEETWDEDDPIYTCEWVGPADPEFAAWLAHQTPQSDKRRWVPPYVGMTRQCASCGALTVHADHKCRVAAPGG